MHYWNPLSWERHTLWKQQGKEEKPSPGRPQGSVYMETEVMMILYVRKSNEGPSTVYSSSGCYHQSPMRQYMTHISSEGFITLLCVCVCGLLWTRGTRSHLLSIFGYLISKKASGGLRPSNVPIDSWTEELLSFKSVLWGILVQIHK